MTATMNPNKGRRYLEEQISGLAPVEILVRMYDIAIASCNQRDGNRLSRVLVEFISALNFEHQDVAVGLFQLYNYCLRLAKAGDFDAVKPILVELRDAWGGTTGLPRPVAQSA